tara:strand:- start:1944 stop:2396 length:453 start_codon:yes stop_codon:yes gene_type:complete
MEFSLFEILGLFQKVDLISRFLAKIDIVDFITSLVIIGTIWGKMGAGTKRVEASFETKFTSFETNSTTRFKDLKDDLDTKITTLTKNNDKNTTRIEKISETLTTKIENVEIKLSNEIAANKAELKGGITSANDKLEKLRELFYTNVKIKK